jgi:hypothetical protein
MSIIARLQITKKYSVDWIVHRLCSAVPTSSLSKASRIQNLTGGLDFLKEGTGEELERAHSTNPKLEGAEFRSVTRKEGIVMV